MWVPIFKHVRICTDLQTVYRSLVCEIDVFLGTLIWSAFVHVFFFQIQSFMYICVYKEETEIKNTDVTIKT